MPRQNQSDKLVQTSTRRTKEKKKAKSNLKTSWLSLIKFQPFSEISETEPVSIPDSEMSCPEWEKQLKASAKLGRWKPMNLKTVFEVQETEGMAVSIVIWEVLEETVFPVCTPTSSPKTWAFTFLLRWSGTRCLSNPVSQ